jgi:hypothetical protein
MVKAETSLTSGGAAMTRTRDARTPSLASRKGGQVWSPLDNPAAMHSLARLGHHLEWLTVNHAESFADERRLLGGLSLDTGAF